MRLEKYINEGKQDFWKQKEGADYLIREVSPDEYEVSVWTRGDTPTDIYKVRKVGKNKWTCNCPSRKKPCKHVSMVKKWLKSGKKDYMLTKKDVNWMKKQLDKMGIKV